MKISVNRPFSIQVRNEFLMSLYQKGVNVFALQPASKVPLVGWKVYQTERVPEYILRVWLKNPNLNFGIATGEISQLVILDYEAQEAAELMAKKVQPTPIISVTARYQHHYYRYPSNTNVGRKIKITYNGKKIKADLLGDASYVVAPYSLHPGDHLVSKEVYQNWDRDRRIKWAIDHNIWYLPLGNWNGETLLTAPMFNPDWIEISNQNIITKFVCKSNNEIRARKYIAKMPPAISGQGGNLTTYIAACRLVKGFDLSPESAFMILKADFNPRCIPEWTDKELWQFIKNATRYGKG